MNEAARDSVRAMAAVRALMDDRDPRTDMAQIMVTLETVVAVTLTAVCQGDHARGAALMNEGLVPGVEDRLMAAAARARDRERGGDG